MIVAHQFSTHGHIVRLAIDKAPIGWNLQEEFDSTVVQTEHYNDWHRVERRMQMLEMKAIEHDFEPGASNH